MKTVKEWLNEINIQKLIGYYQTMYPIYLDDTQLDETITIRRCRDMERSKLQDAIHQLQNLPITLPDDEIQYIIFSHKILIDSSDDETYAIVSVNELLDYCVGADTSGYDMYDPAEILSFLVADTPFTRARIYGLLCDVLLNTITPHLHRDPPRKANPLTILSDADSDSLADLLPSAQEYREKMQAVRKLNLDAEIYWLRDIVKTAIRQYNAYQRTKELYKIYRLLKS